MVGGKKGERERERGEREREERRYFLNEGKWEEL